MSAAARCASSTRSTTTGCCSSRATASRPSTSSCRPRSPTRAACSPASRRSGSRGRARSCPNHLLALRDGRPLDRVPAARDAADRVRRPRLPRRLGLEGLPGDRRGLRARAAGRACSESERLPEPIFTPATKAHDRPRREHRPATQAAELVGAERFAEVERVALELYRFASEHAARARDHHRRHEVRVRPRRRRHARPRRRGVHARLVALLAGRRVRAGRRAAVVRQAVRARLLRDARLGQDRPGPRAPRRGRRRARARATSRRSSA